MGGRFAPSPAVPLRSACLSGLSAPPAVLPLRRAGLPPPFLRYIRNARRRPRPCRPACSGLLRPAPAACRACRRPALRRSFWPPPLYVTNTSVLVECRNAENGHPLHIGASRYRPIRRSAAFSRNFLFLFFLFWHTESNP